MSRRFREWWASDTGGWPTAIVLWVIVGAILFVIGLKLREPPPVPPKLMVTCYEGGVIRPVEINNAVIMTGKDYANLTIMEKGKAPRLYAEDNMFCSVTLSEH
jgi:hypothetical protein